MGAEIGILLWTPYVVLLRIANYATSDVTINVLMYLSPAMSLGLLAVFGHTAGVRLPVAAAGAVVIVAANVMLARRRSTAAAVW